jgi:hypothetical protein
MKPTFKINKEEYSFKDVTLRTYYELRAILAKEETKTSEFEIVECLTGCPIKTLKQLTYSDWLMVWEEANVQIGKLSGDADAIRPIIELNGIKFGLPAVQDLTVGEFADLDVILASGKADERLADIAAVLYRPVIKQKGEKIVLEPYDTDGFEERKELFLDMPITCVRSANAFFLQSATSLLRNTADSLLKEKKKTGIPQDVLEGLQSIIQQDLGGDLSISLQEQMLLDLKKHPSSRFAQLSTGLPGKKTKLVNKIWPFRRNKNTK